MKLVLIFLILLCNKKEDMLSMELNTSKLPLMSFVQALTRVGVPVDV